MEVGDVFLAVAMVGVVAGYAIFVGVLLLLLCRWLL